MESDVQEQATTTTSPSEHLLNKYLPLPYRVATLIVLGMSSPAPLDPPLSKEILNHTNILSPIAFYLYSLNLRHLSTHSIDVPSLLRHPPSPHAHASVQRLSLFLALPLIFSILCYTLYPSAFFPVTYLLYIPLALALPISHLSRRGRGRFLSTLKRVAVGGLAREEEGRFADVLVADVLTSYAKPAADLWVVGCGLVTGRRVMGQGVDRGCGGWWVVPGLIAVPFL